MDKIIIQIQDFDASEEINLIRKNLANIGSIVSFVGIVRELSYQKYITKMTLEYYPKMTQKELESIAKKAKNRWDISAITIIHRVGTLKPKDQIVLVVSASEHRQAAFESCQFIMDYLKTQAPFWKKEYSKNSTKWVEMNGKDLAQYDKWNMNKKE